MQISPAHRRFSERDHADSLVLAPRARKLEASKVEKPWGRTQIPSSFGSTGGRRIGEIWFEHPDHADLPLLAKYIFTSEKLSVQVHPEDVQARERGLPRGKSECWYILDAEPGATLGLGLRAPLSRAELRAAAIDGSIEGLMDWRPVAPGDFFFVPPGTVHAIGAGIALLEFQQNADVTYRLYDYGRPRELHLDDGIEVSRAGPYADAYARRAAGPVDAILQNGPDFCLVRVSSVEAMPPSLRDRRRWVLPIEGAASSHGENAAAGECLFVEPGAELALSRDSVVLVGAAGQI